MYQNKFKKSIFLLVLMIVQFILCRYVFFDLHKIKDVPFMLFDIGIFTMVVGVYNQYSFTSLSSCFGYVAWFVIALIFQSNHLDENGTMTNNLWIIWLLGYLGTLVISVMLDILKKKCIKS